MKFIVDYHQDSYLMNRFPEFVNSEILNEAWSEFAYLEYFNGIKDKQVLEFGGAMGFNLIKLAKTSNVFMIEPSEIGRQYASQKMIKCAKDFEALEKLITQPFDLIFCRHVLEHLTNPLETLIKFKSLLKYNGELLIVLPVETKTKPILNEIDFHLFSWTPRTAINLIKTAGLNPTNWYYNYFTGKRFFLPIYKRFGPYSYKFFMKTLGKIFNACELVITARQ